MTDLDQKLGELRGAMAGDLGQKIEALAAVHEKIGEVVSVLLERVKEAVGRVPDEPAKESPRIDGAECGAAVASLLLALRAGGKTTAHSILMGPEAPKHTVTIEFRTEEAARAFFLAVSQLRWSEG